MAASMHHYMGKQFRFGYRSANQNLNTAVEYQGPNQTNLDSIQAWLKHEEPNSTRQQQKVINQTPSPPEYTPTRRRGQRLKFLGSQKL